MVRWLLFETRIGNWLLSVWERATGLAVIDAEELQDRRVVLVVDGAQ